MIYTPIQQLILPYGLFRIPNANRNVAYLTFDDGPSSDSTYRFLEILSKFDVKASFFVVGQNIEKNPFIVRDLAGNGHLICNHSYFHQPRIYVPTQVLVHEIIKTQNLIERLVTTSGKYFRPPFGRLSFGLTKMLKRLGLKLVIWDVWTRDYKSGYTSDKITKRILRNTKNGSIILLHDHSKNWKETLKALPDIIKKLKDNGFTFDHLPITEIQNNK